VSLPSRVTRGDVNSLFVVTVDCDFILRPDRGQAPDCVITMGVTRGGGKGG